MFSHSYANDKRNQTCVQICLNIDQETVKIQSKGWGWGLQTSFPLRNTNPASTILMSALRLLSLYRLDTCKKIVIKCDVSVYNSKNALLHDIMGIGDWKGNSIRPSCSWRRWLRFLRKNGLQMQSLNGVSLGVTEQLHC